MLAYARYSNLEPDMTEVFIQVIRELDETYLKQQRKDQEQRATKRGPKVIEK
jgi:hypothetical protein